MTTGRLHHYRVRCCDELCYCTAELNESRANGNQRDGDSKPGGGDPKQGNGEIALTVREMADVDVPPDAEAPVLEPQDREAFAEAGVLEKSRSLQPGDRLPPQPLVKTLEEVADKLGKPLQQPSSL